MKNGIYLFVCLFVVLSINPEQHACYINMLTELYAQSLFHSFLL